MRDTIELWVEGVSHIKSISTSMIPPKGSVLYIDGRCWRVTGHPEFVMFRGALVAKIPVEVKPLPWEKEEA